MTVIAVRDHGHVRLIELNRPERRNAFNYEMYHGLAKALRAAAATPEIHVVVLTGRGTAFSAGQDLEEMTAIATGKAVPGTESGFRELLKVVESFELPLIAAVNGPAVGLGFTILAHCDIVLISDTARLLLPFAEMGVPPEAGASYLLPLRMGWQQAAHALFTSDWLDAEAAVQSGIAWRRCLPDVLLAEALSTAAIVAAQPTGAVREIKRLMLAGQLPQVQAAREREEAAFADLFRRRAGEAGSARAEGTAEGSAEGTAEGAK